MARPLAELSDASKGNKVSILQFPSDLGSKSRSHYVQFFIHEIKSTGYTQAAGGTTTNLFSTTGQIGTTGSSPGLNNGTFAIQISPPTEKMAASIALYMPETVTASYQNAYQEDDLTDYTLVYYGKAASALFNADNKLVDNLQSNFLNTITSNPAILALGRKFAGDLLPVDALLKGQGLAINPQVQLLFKATALRQFQFNFLFTPTSQKEAEEVKRIIKAFKYHAAPEIGGGAINNDLFFKMPDIFQIEFHYMDQNGVNRVNDNIHKIDKCVLETIDIDYAASGGGWTAHEGGYPVQTRMTLTFKELNIIDKTKMDREGF